MKPTLRNLVWVVVFLIVGSLVAFIAMGQALGDGLDLSEANTSYSVSRGFLAGLIIGFVFLFFWLGNHISSRKSRFVELAVFAVGWYLFFYIYVTIGAIV